MTRSIISFGTSVLYQCVQPFVTVEFEYIRKLRQELPALVGVLRGTQGLNNPIEVIMLKGRFTSGAEPLVRSLTASPDVGISPCGGRSLTFLFLGGLGFQIVEILTLSRQCGNVRGNFTFGTPPRRDT